jgi:hypothetical protein
MRAHGWRGVTRARTVRTTTPDPAHSRAPDLVKRDFTASAPGQLHVADFTYVPLDGGGFGYTAFVIDAFAGLIAGWECSLSKQTAFVEKAIRQAATLRARQGHPISGAAIHHSDAGSQLAPPCGSPRPSCSPGSAARSDPSGTPTTTPWRKPQSACTNRMCAARVAVSQRPHPHPGRPGGGHQRMGALVQHRKAHAPPGTPATRRSRSRVLGAAGTRGLTWDPRGGPPPAQAGSGSKIRPGARQGYGPPPHVKPRTPWKQADQVTSPQQPPPGATAHTKPGVHETRDAPHIQQVVTEARPRGVGTRFC